MSSLFIGQVPPFRGGISQYNAQLINEMNKIENFQVVSFKKMYPKLFYPGKSEYDFSQSWTTPPNTTFSIKLLNPLTWRKAVNLINQNNFDKVILTWWNLVHYPFYLYLLLSLSSVKFYVISHNLSGHSKNKLYNFLSKKILKFKNIKYIFHHEDIDKFNSNLVKLPMPLHSFNLDSIQYKNSKFTILFFGFIRDYKGVDKLMDIIEKLGSDIELIIAGENWSNLEINHRKVRYINKYISDQELVNLISNSDVIFLPFSEITGSGSLSMAMYYDKPIITTSNKTTKELLSHLEDSFLIQHEDFVNEVLEFINSCKNTEYYEKLVRNAKKRKKYLFKNYASDLLDYF